MTTSLSDIAGVAARGLFAFPARLRTSRGPLVKACRILMLFLAIPLVAAGAEKAEEGFRPLFNGKDLAGWVPVNTAPSTWAVRGAMIIC